MVAPESTSPIIVWFRSDLRLRDNPALAAAVAAKLPVIPVFILDDVSPGSWKRGGASRWWLHQSLSQLKKEVPFIFSKGDAETELLKIVRKTKAQGVFWNRCYEPWAIARDKKIKQALKENGVMAESFNGGLLFEPWEIMNKSGGPYKVFTPYSNACFSRPVRPADTAKLKIKWHDISTRGALDALGLMPDIKWYKGMEKMWEPGEAGAARRLDAVLDEVMADYKKNRDFPAKDGTSRLSPHLHFGELSPHQAWGALSHKLAAVKQSEGAQALLRQLIWREFSWYLLYHFPEMPDKSWNVKFVGFQWQANKKLLTLWQRGLTGYPIVDAGMRQLWQRGWMHNRVRMIVGSFLVKHLQQDWRLGEKWFWDTLVDADLGNNAAGWQWIAGCGADAAPYFRIFNPVLQSEKFDTDGDYIREYVPELSNMPAKYIHAPWQAPAQILTEAGVKLGDNYPEPVIEHGYARTRALEAYKNL
jgi:deoxyribodipyrimidine photo-lyase